MSRLIFFILRTLAYTRKLLTDSNPEVTEKITDKLVSEYDQEIPRSQTADKPMAS